MKSIYNILLLCAVVCLWGCISEEEEQVVNRVKVGDVVPSFAVLSADGVSGEGFEPSDFEGRRSVVVFFQTTCGDCRREMPKIHEAWLHFADNSADPEVRFILISRGENAATVAEYWTSATTGKPSFAPMPYYLDPNREAFNKFANSYVPRLYLVGTDGRVKFMAIETFDFDSAELIAVIEKM
jgi:thiol-disulfide isomerase/thioredoxin